MNKTEHAQAGNIYKLPPTTRNFHKAPIKTNSATLEKGIFHVVGESLEDFCSKYGLKIKTLQCRTCSAELKTTLMFYCEGYACLEAPVCKCGKKDRRVIFQPYAEKEIEFWSDKEEEYF